MDEPRIEDARRALEPALYRVLKALARLCIRHGVSFDAAATLARQAFVEVAHPELTISVREQSTAHVSTLTGIPRREVSRLLKATHPDDRCASEHINAMASILGAWRRAQPFVSRRGRPLALPFDGGPASFVALVERHGRGGLVARRALDDLLRIGAVTEDRDGRLRLHANGYVPARSSVEAYAILGNDVSDLIGAIDHNLSVPSDPGFFQRKVAYDNIPAEALGAVRELAEQEGNAVMEKLDREIARSDRDANPAVAGTGRRRAMVGVYYFEDEIREE